MSTLYQKLQQQVFFITGPCVIESEELVLEIAAQVATLQQQFPSVVFIFKASFDKANRTSIHSFRGLGIEKGLAILEKVKKEYNLPILTDIHEPQQATIVAQIADILQIPAFLCRQTDLLLAAGNTQKIINIKKAQFLSSSDMEHVLGKIQSTGNTQLLLTERGTMFGYNNLVVDFTGILEMQQFGYPVVMDATHATQKPGGLGGKSGGNRAFAPKLANAAAAVGVRGFFMEAHPDPTKALSDGSNMVYMSELIHIMEDILKISTLKLNH